MSVQDNLFENERASGSGCPHIKGWRLLVVWIGVVIGSWVMVGLAGVLLLRALL